VVEKYTLNLAFLLRGIEESEYNTSFIWVLSPGEPAGKGSW